MTSTDELVLYALSELIDALRVKHPDISQPTCDALADIEVALFELKEKLQDAT